MKGLRVFTAQYNYKREERMDTTVKTGEQFVAPTWDIALGHKAKKITDEEYTQQYLHMLDVSMQNNPKLWVGLLRRRKVVLVCFCGREQFCHRHILAMWLTKMGAKYMGEINTNTDVLIPVDRHLPKCLSMQTQEMIMNYQPKEKETQADAPTRKMVVDPLTVNSVQSSICRNCRDNRSATVREQFTNKVLSVSLSDNDDDAELNSRTFNCCSMKFDNKGVPEYKCPIFSQLIDGYFAGVTSQGTNINPCKHCIDWIDNGGKCMGDRCPDGPFPIKEGAGLVKC